MPPLTDPAPAPAPPADEADWIRRARAGEREAFRPLVERHQARVHNLCLRLLGRRHDAEEAAQEAFLRAWHALERFDLGRPFVAWIAEIAVNVCRDRRRAGWWRKVLVGEAVAEREVDHAPPADQSLSRAEELAALVRAMQELKAGDREALALSLEELPATEAARALGISPNALYVRQSRARARLAELLRERHPELFDG